MSKKVRFNVVNRPTKEKVGRTDVVLETIAKDGSDSEMTQLGYITKARGVAQFVANTSDGTEVGSFATRSQAGHALERKAAE